MPRTEFAADPLVLDAKKQTIKFNKTVQHDDSVPKIHAIENSINKRISKLDCKVIGITYISYDGDKHKYMYHVGDSRKNVHRKRGHVMVTLS